MFYSHLIQFESNPIHINLMGNDLCDEGTDIVCCSLLGERRKVEELNMSCNRISIQGAVALSNLVRSSRTLRELRLFGNQLRDAGAMEIVKSLPCSSSLQLLDLSCNHMSCDAAIALAEGLCGNVSLTSIDLSGNAIGDEGACALASACTTNGVVVEDLNLSRNQVGDIGAMAFASVLAYRTTTCLLQHLILSDNEIGPTGARALALSLTRNKSLLTLDLRFNERFSSSSKERFWRALQINCTLTSCRLVQNLNDRVQLDIDFMTKLNQSGRKVAQHDAELLPLVLAHVNEDPAMVFFLLRQSPHIWIDTSASSRKQSLMDET